MDKMDTPDNNNFKSHRWGSEIYRSIQSYWHIQTFFGDTKVLESYLDSHKSLNIVKFVDGGLLLEDGSIIELPDEDDEFEPSVHTISLTQDEIKANLQEAGQFYTRQMIVVTATYIELILRDFVGVAFRKYPERMHNFLDKGNGHKAAVSLKLIMKAPSLVDLLYDLSEQAASNAVKGRFKSQLNNLAKIIPEQEIAQNLQDELVSIVDRRNRIVHEASQEEISVDEVRHALDTCLELLVSLANIAVKCGILLDTPKYDEGDNPL